MTSLDNNCNPHVKGLRVNAQNKMYSPVHRFREKNHNDLWNERRKMTITVGDNFFKKSERYMKNPDYSPKHVDANWAVKDACDYVRPSATQMQGNYSVTEGSVPLFKAYNIYENANQNWDERMNKY